MTCLLYLVASLTSPTLLPFLSMKAIAADHDEVRGQLLLLLIILLLHLLKWFYR